MARKTEWIDPDDAPPLGPEFFRDGAMKEGDRVIRPAKTTLTGRPLSPDPKRQVTLRLDPDVLAHFKSGGRGWQTRINAALRKSMAG